MRRLFLATLRNKHHIAFIIACILSLQFIFSTEDPTLLQIRSRASDTFALMYKPVAFFRSLINLDEENAQLRALNMQLALELERLQSYRTENERLRELVGFKQASPLTLLPANVINMGLTPGLVSMVIDVGSRDQVRENLPVLTPKGVVGKTLVVGENSTVVQLLSDMNYRLSVRIMPSAATGILRWKERGHGEVRDVRKTAEINVGDKVLTSGFSDIYPKNLPVGEVVGILDERGSFEKIVTVKVHNDLNSLLDVFVILDEVDEQE